MGLAWNVIPKVSLPWWKRFHISVLVCIHRPGAVLHAYPDCLGHEQAKQCSVLEPQLFPHIKSVFWLAGAWRQQPSASVLNTGIVICTLPSQGVFTLKGILFSLSVFVRVVHHASCFHLHSFPDFPLTQLTASIIWQHLLRLWPSEPLAAPWPSVSHLRWEFRPPSSFLQYNTLLMSFQMLCGRADITDCCISSSGSHQPGKMNRLPVIPCVCICVCLCTHASPTLQCQFCSCTALAPLMQWQHLALLEDFFNCHRASDLS